MINKGSPGLKLDSWSEISRLVKYIMGSTETSLRHIPDIHAKMQGYLIICPYSNISPSAT